MMTKIKRNNKSRFLSTILTKDNERKKSSSTGAGVGNTVSNAFRSICSRYLNPGSVKKRYYFYEWSDLTRKPLEFSTRSELMAYMTRSHIIVKAFQQELFSAMEECHIVCKRGSSEIVVRNSLERLKDSASTW